MPNRLISAPPLPADYPSYDAYIRALARYEGQAPGCHHCWHAPLGEVRSFPAPHVCCWCGATTSRAVAEQPLHGSFVPQEP